MALQIEPKESLTDFERQYLLDRGRNPDDYIIGASNDEGPQDIAGVTPRDAILAGDTSDGTSRFRGEGNPHLLDVGDDEDVPYGEWTNDELRAEIKLRNRDREDADKIRPIADNKQSLVEALEADDANGDDEGAE